MKPHSTVKNKQTKKKSFFKWPYISKKYFKAYLLPVVAKHKMGGEPSYKINCKDN